MSYLLFKLFFFFFNFDKSRPIVTQYGKGTDGNVALSWVGTAYLEGNLARVLYSSGSKAIVSLWNVSNKSTS